MKPRIAVIGCGVWGKNLVRNFYNLEVLDTVCDMRQENIDAIKDNYQGVKFINNIDEVISSKDITGVVVATPSHTHYDVVKKALLSGKDVYVEKPIATTADQAKELKDLSEELGRVLMVGHLLLYHPAVARLRELVAEGVLGDIVYAQSDRLNINYFKNDKSVMWDLAPHDISMISYIIGKKPVSVKSAVGFSTSGNDIMDIVHLDLNFEDDVYGHISTSWIHPQKRVMLLIRGTKASAMLDDTVCEHKILIFENNSNKKEDILTPEYMEIEPLKLEWQHFINCIINRTKPRSDGTNGYEVIKIIEEADKYMLGSDYQKLNNYKFSSSRTAGK